MSGRFALAIQRASRAAHIPSDRLLHRWVAAALGPRRAQLALRFVTPAEARKLNRDFRGRDYATNVLTFVYSRTPLEGDIVVCPAVVRREARAAGRSDRAHYAHLVVHGVLHLRGYDHEDEADAARMERREKNLLAALGFDDPYADPTA